MEVPEEKELQFIQDSLVRLQQLMKELIKAFLSYHKGTHWVKEEGDKTERRDQYQTFPTKTMNTYKLI